MGVPWLYLVRLSCCVLAGSLDVHGFCMVFHPCIDDPLRLGYLIRLGCHLGECYWLTLFSSLHGMALGRLSASLWLDVG